MEIYAEKCLKSSNSLILEIKSWRELWIYHFAVFSGTGICLCAISDRHLGSFVLKNTLEKPLGKPELLCCGGSKNLLESSSVQMVIWVQGSLRQTRLNALLPNPKQSYNLLRFLMDLTQAKGPCKMSVPHTRSASCLFCPEAGEHLQSWKWKANKLKITRPDLNV